MSELRKSKDFFLSSNNCCECTIMNLIVFETIRVLRVVMVGFEPTTFRLLDGRSEPTELQDLIHPHGESNPGLFGSSL